MPRTASAGTEHPPPQTWKECCQGGRGLSDFGSEVGASILRQAILYAAMLAPHRAFIWENACNRQACRVRSSVVVLGVVGSSPIIHPIEIAGKQARAG